MSKVIEEAKEFLAKTYEKEGFNVHEIINDLLKELESKNKEIERYKAAANEIDVMEICSPESDEWIKGFESCKHDALNILEPWPDDNLKEQEE